MISITRIFEETSFFLPKIVSYTKDYHPSLINLEFLEGDQHDFVDNVLYVGLASLVGGIVNSAENIVLFLVKDCNLPYEGLASRNIVIVEYPPETDIFHLFNTIKALFYKEWDFLNSASDLLKALLYSNNLDELLEIAARLVQNPVNIMDVSYKVLAYSKSIKIEDAAWLKIIEMGGFTYEYISAIQRFDASFDIPKDNTPYIQKNDISPARRLISRLYANGSHLGYIATLETNQFFEKISPDLYKLISDTIAKTIMSDKSLQISKGYPNHESMLIDLIEGNINNKIAFWGSIKGTNLGQSTMFQVITIEIDNYSHKSTADNFLKCSLEAIFPKSWSFYYNDSIVLLIDLRNSTYLTTLERNSLEKLFEKNDLRAGISNVFTDLFKLPFYYRQAVRTLEISKRLQSPGITVDYENFKFYDMILTLPKADDSDENGLINFCSLTMLKIREHDRLHSTEYLKTLWTFLNSNKNLSKTASNLYIHSNTAAYRIQKLKELFDIDMQDDFLLFNLYCSYLLLTCIDKL